jgi:hypothetical protein
MTPEESASPAGESEVTSLTQHAAAEAFAQFDDELDAPEADSTPVESSDQVEEPQSTEPSLDGDEPTDETASEDASPAEEAEPKPEEPEDEPYAHGNTKTRLRDGTVTTVAELKKLADEAREYRARIPQLSAAQQQLQAKAAQLAQQEQLFQTALPQAVHLLQQQIPPAPDPALMQSDPIAHYEQEYARNQKLAQLRNLQAAAAARTQQQQLAQQAQLTERLKAESSKLAEKIPDLATPAKRQEVYDSVVKTASNYGFEPGEVNNVYDHRLLHMVHDLSAKAAAYDKLLATQAKQRETVQKKVAGAPPVAPVQTPGRRPSAGEGADRQRAELIQRAKSRGGRPDDVARLFADFD